MNVTEVVELSSDDSPSFNSEKVKTLELKLRKMTQASVCNYLCHSLILALGERKTETKSDIASESSSGLDAVYHYTCQGSCRRYLSLQYAI